MDDSKKIQIIKEMKTDHDNNGNPSEKINLPIPL
jgi:hypothetical protein